MPRPVVNPFRRVKAPVIVAVVGVGVGFAAGWGTGRLGSSQPQPAPPPASNSVPTKVGPAAPAERTTRPEAETLLRGLALETALRTALAEPDDELRRERLRSLATQTDLETYADALGKADRILAPNDRQIYRLRLLELLTVRDPVAAVAAARTTPESGLRSLALGTVLQAWARHDAAALLRWHGAQPDAERRAQLGSLGTALGLYSPSVGLEFYRGLKLPNEQRAFAQELFGAWSQRDPVGAFQAGSPVLLAAGLGPQVGELLIRWAQHDLAAARAALKQLGAPDKHWDVFQSFFNGLAGQQRFACIVRTNKGGCSQPLPCGALEAILEHYLVIPTFRLSLLQSAVLLC
jgi:hypothetical protein